MVQYVLVVYPQLWGAIPQPTIRRQTRTQILHHLYGVWTHHKWPQTPREKRNRWKVRKHVTQQKKVTVLLTFFPLTVLSPHQNTARASTFKNITYKESTEQRNLKKQVTWESNQQWEWFNSFCGVTQYYQSADDTINVMTMSDAIVGQRTLIFLEASPRDRGRKWECARGNRGRLK